MLLNLLYFIYMRYLVYHFVEHKNTRKYLIWIHVFYDCVDLCRFIAYAMIKINHLKLLLFESCKINIHTWLFVHILEICCYNFFRMIFWTLWFDLVSGTNVWCLWEKVLTIVFFQVSTIIGKGEKMDLNINQFPIFYSNIL